MHDQLYIFDYASKCVYYVYMLGFQADFDLLHFLLSLYRATYIYFIACRIHNYIIMAWNY